MSIDAGPDRRTSKSEFAQIFRVAADILGSFAHRDSISGEFLAKPDWHSVLHVGAAGLHDFPEFFSFFLEAAGYRVKHWIEILQLDQSRQPHGGRKNIVGG